MNRFYGTALPLEKLHYATFEMDASGDVVFAFKITQSGVSDNFRMPVPIYLELANGNTVLPGAGEDEWQYGGRAEGPVKRREGEKPCRALMNY